ncbi:hypothetical protein K4F52_005497 [Lecanicillium sp. MT-2017a]|nr:hypothetical protein K4F52_005497 [Lecanicillium sp. MT-2017a]
MAAAQSSISPPYRQVRAQYDNDTITVYQAYSAAIAEPAVAAQKLNASPDFKPTRMTWIKPSWCWMMYRAGYSYKDARQARILALRMKRSHFIGLLERGVLSTHAAAEGDAAEGSGRDKAAEVRVQWDPERTPALEKLSYRSIQIGIPASLSEQWVNEWIVSIEDVTARARALKAAIDEDAAVTIETLMERGLIPVEKPFDVPEDIQSKLDLSLAAPAS